MEQRIPRDREDLEERLREVLRHLDHYCGAFDSGDETFAKPIANAIRTLVHDTKQSVSVLSQLGVKASFSVFDHRGPGTEGSPQGPSQGSAAITSNPRLAMLAHYVDQRPASFVPLFRVENGLNMSRVLSFDEWWKSDALEAPADIRATRRRLVLWLANTDGGSHVDPGLEPDYYSISRRGGMGWQHIEGGGIELSVLPSLPLHSTRSVASSPVPASVRHVAEEVRASIRHQCASLLGEVSATQEEPQELEGIWLFSGLVQIGNHLGTTT